MEQTQGCNPGIVHQRALQTRRPGDPLERSEVAFAFGEKPARKTHLEPPYGIQGYIQRCRIPEDARVGYDRKKLVEAGPGGTDGLRAGDCLGEYFAGGFMKGHLRSMRVYEHIRIYGNHAPCSR